MDSYFFFLSNSLPLFWQGTAMTLKILAGAAFLSGGIGLFFGLLVSARLKVRWVSPCIEGIGFVLRAVPFVVQLLIVYFVLPDLLDIDLEAVSASVIALGLCSSGYVMQIVRGGIDAIPSSQWEAAFCLGYSTLQSLRYVILPQISRIILPACTNELEALLKSTAMVSSIGVLELTRVAMNFVSREMQPIPIYLTAAFFYVCMSAAIHAVSNVLKRRSMYVKC